jgi:hypothetical protein
LFDSALDYSHRYIYMSVVVIYLWVSYEMEDIEKLEESIIEPNLNADLEISEDDIINEEGEI